MDCWDMERFLCLPEGTQSKSVVRDRLRGFMTRAFRRPVPEEVLSRYTQYVNRQLDTEWIYLCDEGSSFCGVLRRGFCISMTSLQHLSKSSLWIVMSCLEAVISLG